MKTEILTAIDTRMFIKELAPLLREELKNITEQKAYELERSEYLNIKESQKYLNLSTAKFQEAIQYTGLEPYNVLGKKCYKRSELDDMMKKFKD